MTDLLDDAIGVPTSGEDRLQEIAESAADLSAAARHNNRKRLKHEFLHGMDPVPALVKALIEAKMALNKANQKRMNMCRYGTQCARDGCHFNHPGGYVPQEGIFEKMHRQDRKMAYLERQWREGFP